MALNEAQKKERSEYLERNLEITECSQRKPYVFISYASDNWETVFKTAIVPMQKKYGLSVYADKAFDKVNDKWIVPMLRNIRGADVIVAFVSQSYIESYACFLELLTAVNNRKQIVFVSLEDRLHLGDTTDQPEVERGVKSEILNQGANIATNTNNTSNDIMRAMKSAYTSISTLLEQDALSKYDISDAFINFFRDASINRKTINDLTAVKGTIASVSGRVFDKSLITEPAAPKSKPKPEPAPQEPETREEPVPVPEAAAEAAPEAAPQQPPVRTVEPAPRNGEPADFSWEQAGQPEEKGKKSFGKKEKPAQAEGDKKKSKKPLIIGAAVAVVLLFILLIGGGDATEVTDQPYDMTDGSGDVFSGVYTGEWSKRNKWPNGEGVFALADGAGTYTGQWVDGVAQGQGSMTWTSGASYEGEWLAGMRTGQGTMYYDDDTVYVGEFKENKRDGQGRRTWSDGGYIDGEWKDNEANGHVINYIGGDENNPEARVYEGEYVNGKREGTGTFTWPSGQKYEGEWKEGKYNGQGTLTYSDGSVFVGTFVDGEKDGDAVYTRADGTVVEEKWSNGNMWLVDKEYTTPGGEAGTYTGFFDLGNSVPMGFGTMKYANGQIYVGDWVDGDREGQGRWTWPDGGFYDGEWKNGKRHGQGTFTWANGSYYEGGWKDGKYNGQGKYVVVDEDGKTYTHYEGDYVDGHWEGHGVKSWANGNKVEGEFVADKLNGYAVYTVANPQPQEGYIAIAKFEGEYVDDKRNGKGKLTYNDGSYYEGTFVDGEKNGEGLYTRKDGSQVKEVWDHGTKVE